MVFYQVREITHLKSGINQKKVIDLATAHHKISIRPEVEFCPSPKPDYATSR